MVRLPVALRLGWSITVAFDRIRLPVAAGVGWCDVGWTHAVGPYKRPWQAERGLVKHVPLCRSCHAEKLRPNQRLHLTPLCGEKIGAILAARCART